MVQLPVCEEMPAPVDFCGLAIRPVRQAELIDLLVARAQQGIRTCAHYLNAHTFNLSRKHPDFREILATSDLLYADGMSVVVASRLFGQEIPERLTAADYFELFARKCAEEGLSLYLLGGADGVAQAAADVLTERIAGLRIAGTGGGYFAEAQSDTVIERINASRADVLVVGMGSPRQESWVARHDRRLAVPVRWVVGALFDYFAGGESRAPQWLCRCGGEWLYRLIQKPGKHWRRYLLGNSRFVWGVLRERMARRGTGKEQTVL